MAKIGTIDEAAFEEWLSERPACIRELARRFPPDRLYMLGSSRVTILAYNEDGTLRVDVSARHNFLTFEREVFGVKPEDLTECDPLPEDAPRGALLTEEDEIEGFTKMMDRCGIMPPE